MIKSPIRSKLSLVLAALLLTAFRKVVNADSSYKRLRKSLEAENIEEEKVQNDEENNIVNGGSTLQVLSWFAQFSNDRAAGVLIHESVVLTAAHAVDDGQCPDAVRIGSYQRTEGGDLVSVKPGSCLIHPRYSKAPNKFDFALMKLSRPVTNNVVNYNDQTINFPNNTRFTVYGFGNVANAPGTLSDSLQQIVMDHVPNCEENYKGFYMEDIMICANNDDEGGGVCKGDAGAPLIYSVGSGDATLDYLVGIASFVANRENCGNPAGPDVFARVSAVSDWIEEGIEYLTATDFSNGSSGCCLTRAFQSWVKSAQQFLPGW